MEESPMTHAGQLRDLILNHPPVVAPGAFDGLSARLVEQAGLPRSMPPAAASPAATASPTWG